MFGSLRSLVGFPSVKIKADEITVSGVSAYSMQRDIKKLWGTDRVSKYMFTDIGPYSFTFKSFFLPDVAFTINKMLSQKSTVTSVRTLNKVKDVLFENTWLANTVQNKPSRFNREYLKEFFLTPLDFQEELFTIYDQNIQKYNLNGFLFAGSVGSGKTFTSLALAYCLEKKKIIIVCPKNTIYRVWEANLKEKIKTPPKYWISAEKKPMTGDERVLIYHYEDMEKLYEYIATGIGVSPSDLMIILDESHNLNETTSARSNQFNEICKISKCGDILWLSGTPIKALSKESIPLLRSIDPLFTPAVEDLFKRIFRGDAGRATEILNQRLGLIMFTVEKERLKLPEPITKQIKVKSPIGDKFTLDSIYNQMQEFIQQRMLYYKTRQSEDENFYNYCIKKYELTLKNDKQRAELNQYKSFVKVIISANARDVNDEMAFCNRFEKEEITKALSNEDKAKFKDVKSIIKYLHLKIKGECLGTIVGGARIACTVEIAKNINYNLICESVEKKTLVFTSYVDALREASIACSSQGLKSIEVYAKTNKDLPEIVKRLTNDESINPLIATFDSLSTGVPMTMCNALLMLNLPFRDYELQQAIGRISRLDSNTDTYVYSAFLDTGDKPNISTRTKDILEWSQKQVEAIVGISTPYDLSKAKDVTDFNTAMESFKEFYEGVKEEKPKFCAW
jgi:superfamily II DNA or RNA helicase